MTTIKVVMDCPGCLANGEHRQLLQDLPEERVYCSAEPPHEYASVELVGEGQPDPVTDVLEQNIGPVTSFVEPEAALPTRGAEPTEVNPLGIAPETTLPPPPIQLAPPTSSPLPGGDVRVQATIVISEANWMSVRARAEELKLTPEQYAQDCLNHVLSTGWLL